MIELPQLLSRDLSQVSMKKLYQLFFPLSSMKAYLPSGRSASPSFQHYKISHPSSGTASCSTSTFLLTVKCRMSFFLKKNNNFQVKKKTKPISHHNSSLLGMRGKQQKKQAWNPASYRAFSSEPQDTKLRRYRQPHISKDKGKGI